MKILIILLFIFLLISCQPNQADQICINEVCFEVEIADNQEERTQGLMHREELDQNKGMLFIYNESKISKFWMKNTLIPLDIIWIDENLEIVHIEKNVQPCITEICETYGLDIESKYVLEINSGLSDEYNFSKNNDILIKNI